MTTAALREPTENKRGSLCAVHLLWWWLWSFAADAHYAAAAASAALCSAQSFSIASRSAVRGSIVARQCGCVIRAVRRTMRSPHYSGLSTPPRLIYYVFSVYISCLVQMKAHIWDNRLQSVVPLSLSAMYKSACPPQHSLTYYPYIQLIIPLYSIHNNNARSNSKRLKRTRDEWEKREQDRIHSRGLKERGSGGGG